MGGMDSKDADPILELDPDDFECEGVGDDPREPVDNTWIMVEDARLIDPSLGGWIIDIVILSEDMTLEQKRAAFQDYKRLENLQKNGIASLTYDKETGIIRLQHLPGCALHQLPGAVFQILKKYSNGIGAYRSALRVPMAIPNSAREKSINEVPVVSWMPPAEEKMRVVAALSSPQIIERDSREVALEDGKFTLIQLQLPYSVSRDGEVVARTGQKDMSAEKHAENSRIFGEVILKVAAKEGLSATVVMLSAGKIILKKRSEKVGGLSDESIAVLMKYVVEVR